MIKKLFEELQSEFGLTPWDVAKTMVEATCVWYTTGVFEFQIDKNPVGRFEVSTDAECGIWLRWNTSSGHEVWFNFVVVDYRPVFHHLETGDDESKHLYPILRDIENRFARWPQGVEVAYREFKEEIAQVG